MIRRRIFKCFFIPCGLKRNRLRRWGRNFPRIYRVRKKVDGKISWIISQKFLNERQEKMTDVNREREEFKFFVFLCFGSKYLFGITPSTFLSYLPWQISQSEKFLTLCIHLWRQPLCAKPTVPEHWQGTCIKVWFDEKQIRQHGRQWFVSLSSLVDQNVDIYLHLCPKFVNEKFLNWNKISQCKAVCVVIWQLH